MRMAAEPRSGPFDAGTLAARAWLAALPDELAAQRRVMAGLVDRCEAWPLVTSLQVGCSLGRGTAGQRAGIKGTAPWLGRHSHHLSCSCTPPLNDFHVGSRPIWLSGCAMSN